MTFGFTNMVTDSQAASLVQALDSLPLVPSGVEVSDESGMTSEEGSSALSTPATPTKFPWWILLLIAAGLYYGSK